MLLSLRLIVCSLIILVWSSAQATTIEQLSLDNLLHSAQLVFEGRVVGSEVSQNPTSGRIYTFVTFQILDTIKGLPPGGTVQLRFLGGSYSDLTLAVAEMHIPQMGEHGIYFVESLDRPLVNPFSGWCQGHYIAQTNPVTGQESVYTCTHRPVTGFAPEEQSTPNAAFSRGYPLGLSASEGQTPEAGLTLKDFKEGLRDRLSH